MHINNPSAPDFYIVHSVKLDELSLIKRIHRTFRLTTGIILSLLLLLFNSVFFNLAMPLRCLIHYVNDIQNDVKYTKEDLYRRKLISLPTPHFVVFYNGLEDRPEKEVMKLSDSFYHKTSEPNMEVVCTAYNINPGYNPDLKKDSNVLYGYSVFVDKVRKNLTTKELSEAISVAIDECIAEDIQKDFFITRRDEVEKVTKLDFTFETREKMIKRDTRAETIEELQPQIDALKADNKKLSDENSVLAEELAKYKAAFGELQTTDAGAESPK